MAQWEYMTLTLAGGDSLYSALVSVQVGHFGGHWKEEDEIEKLEYVGGYEEDMTDTRVAPDFPLYPFYHDADDPHAYITKYKSLMCVLRQRYKWIDAVSGDPVGVALYSQSLPQQVIYRGKSESIDPVHANTKVTLNFAFPEVE